MPPNYEALRAAPASVASHQRRWAWGIGAALIVSGLGGGVWAAAEGSSHKAGPCVSVVLASSTGGIDLEHCGTNARNWCASKRPDGSNAAANAEIWAACRRDGLLPH
jgi:hypothetical protein